MPENILISVSFVFSSANDLLYANANAISAIKILQVIFFRQKIVMMTSQPENCLLANFVLLPTLSRLSIWTMGRK